MPLNSRGLRRYKVYKDLRPPCTYVEVCIHIHVTRGGYTWRGGAVIIKARRDRESFIVAGLHFIPHVCGRKSNKTPLWATTLDSLPTANDIKQWIFIYVVKRWGNA